ncbi:MAG: hypothetical protein WBA87_15165 [Microbacterium sp.]
MADAFLVSASAADDTAFIALRDLSEVLGDEEETGIIGGHMVSLLTASFPSPGCVPRRTNDADGGIPKALARSGEVHDRLLAHDYLPTSSNRYVHKSGDGTQQILDLLVPSLATRLGKETLGSREFDSMPGLGVALARRLRIAVEATLSTGEELRFTAHVPSVEGAIVLKAYAWAGRRARKDAIDLHSLFRIVESHDADVIGGWRLDEAPPVGSRLDTSRTLHDLARNWEARPPRATFDYLQLVSSIRTHVAAPPR